MCRFYWRSDFVVHPAGLIPVRTLLKEVSRNG